MARREDAAPAHEGLEKMPVEIILQIALHAAACNVANLALCSSGFRFLFAEQGTEDLDVNLTVHEIIVQSSGGEK